MMRLQDKEKVMCLQEAGGGHGEVRVMNGFSTPDFIQGA